MDIWKSAKIVQKNLHQENLIIFREKDMIRKRVLIGVIAVGKGEYR